MAREYLISLRKQHCETQQAVAKSIDVTRQNYSQIEKGIRQQRMDIVTAKRLADHFGVSLDYIVEHETQETPLAVDPLGVSLPVLPVQMAEGGVTKTEKVFISGPMRTPGYEKDFAAAAGKLAEDGYEPMNPAVAIPADMDRPAAMRIALAMIDAADSMYFLPNWGNSMGCFVERAYGNYLGKRIFGNPPAPLSNTGPACPETGGGR